MRKIGPKLPINKVSFFLSQGRRSLWIISTLPSKIDMLWLMPKYEAMTSLENNIKYSAVGLFGPSALSPLFVPLPRSDVPLAPPAFHHHHSRPPSASLGLLYFIHFSSNSWRKTLPGVFASPSSAEQRHERFIFTSTCQPWSASDDHKTMFLLT